MRQELIKAREALAPPPLNEEAVQLASAEGTSTPAPSATLPAPQKATYEKDYLELQQEFTERTNKLIIRDVVDRVEGILRLIETLDQPTPQVVIEARIVETRS